MTAVVGVVDGSHVWIGADSAGVANWSVVNRKDPKVFRLGPMLVGFTSSFRMGQLIRYSMKAPPEAPPEDPYAYMVSEFVPRLRKCLKRGGFAKVENGREEAGTMLIGYCGHLFEIGEDYQVGEGFDGYAAVGGGYEVALGALYASGDHLPADRVKIALEAAAAHHIGVRPPFVVEML